jgi:hypothetical protein
MAHPEGARLVWAADWGCPEPLSRSWDRSDGRVAAGYRKPRSADASVDVEWLAWAERALAVIVNGQFVDLGG